MPREQKRGHDARQELRESGIELQHGQEIHERDGEAEEVLQTGLGRRDADVQAPERVRDEQADDELNDDEPTIQANLNGRCTLTWSTEAPTRDASGTNSASMGGAEQNKKNSRKHFPRSTDKGDY